MHEIGYHCENRLLIRATVHSFYLHSFYSEECEIPMYHYLSNLVLFCTIAVSSKPLNCIYLHLKNKISKANRLQDYKSSGYFPLGFGSLFADNKISWYIANHCQTSLAWRWYVTQLLLKSDLVQYHTISVGVYTHWIESITHDMMVVANTTGKK